MRLYISTLSVLCILLFPFNLNAQAYNNYSKLELLLPSSGLYHITIDDREYDSYSNIIRINKLRQGNHRVSIVEEPSRNRLYYKTIYKGHVYIPYRSIVKARITKYFKLKVYKMIRRKPHNTNRYCSRPSLNLPQVKASLRAASFESDKKIIAKQAISYSAVEAWQIREIIKQFSFESSRLEIAIFAFNYCIDKQNYFLINKAFSFRSSIDELNEYLASQTYSSEVNDWNASYSDDDYYRDEW